jgi:LemA protein
MKKWMIVLGIIALVGVFTIIGFISRGIGIHNQIIALDEGAKAQWAQVQNVYQRRADLVPNLVATVEGYTEHESTTLTQIAEARSKMGGVVKLDESLMRDPAAMAKFQQAQSTFAGGLQRLMMVSERYPDLKASQQFQDLMIQLEGTENRISTERGRYNEAVRAFNTFIRQFPNSFIAGFMNSVPLVPFEADAQAQEAPKVEFGKKATP